MNVIKFFRKRMNKKGFTLVELLLVIALLAVIGGIFVPRVFGTLNNARIDADIVSARNLAHQAQLLIATGQITNLDASRALINTDLQIAELPDAQVDGREFHIYYSVGSPNSIQVGYASGTDGSFVNAAGDAGSALETLELIELDL